MKKLLTLTFMGMCASASAQSVQGLQMTIDKYDNPIQSGYPACGHINQVPVTTAGTMVSATWPAGTTDIIFYPPSAGINSGRPNGVGACPTGAVTNGTGCEDNMTHRRIDVMISNTIPIAYYGVTNSVTGTVIKWCDYSKNKN